MSKLRERIRSTRERRSVPFGFGPRSREAESQRHVLVLAEVDDADAAAAAASAGADALLAGADGIEAVVEGADGRPVGARVEAATSADADALIEAGADFLVFDDAQTEAAALLRPDLGHVALLEDATAAEEDLRLLQPLDLDAILLPSARVAATVRDQLLTRRIAELTRKPLIVPVDGSVDATQLEVWRDAGALVALVAGDAASIEAVVAAAVAVPAPRERREDRPNALVPSPASGLLDEDDDEPL
ncbi:MAG: hypothetical protein OXH97_04745 [Chloroflexota bacterium]|nr:hypothetical protein [Chloroflexota bacterium]